jgi:hypothetical protein
VSKKIEPRTRKEWTSLEKADFKHWNKLQAKLKHATPLIRQWRGPWCPTNYLRWKGSKLEQKMRRRVKISPDNGRAYTHYEYEWQRIERFA